MKIGIITLDQSWTKCLICDLDIPTNIGLALPMYGGEVDHRSYVGFPVCSQCYAANQYESEEKWKL